MPALERSNAIIRKRVRAVLDRQARTQQNPLFTGQVSPTPFSTRHQVELVQPIAYQTVSNLATTPSFTHLDPTKELVTSMQWQPGGIRTNLNYDPGFYHEDVPPTFPGQHFPVGSEYNFGSNESEAQAKTALMGYSLDPYPRLNSGDVDWRLMDVLEAPVLQQI